jgi:hypothetical protein
MARSTITRADRTQVAGVFTGSVYAGRRPSQGAHGGGLTIWAMDILAIVICLVVFAALYATIELVDRV